MISIPIIEELRETRRRLAEEAGLDVQRYAALLRAGSGQQRPVTYVTSPLLPPMAPPRLPVAPQSAVTLTRGASKVS